MLERQLAEIDVKPGAAMETQSGLQMMRPRIYGAYERPRTGANTGVLMMHPASNFMNHHLLRPLAERGFCALGLNSRYINNDSILIMERVIQDIGAGVKFLRTLGCDKVVLLGYSGGAAISAFYQAQATELTVETTPAGDPVHLVPDDLPPVDGLALCAAHAGRSRIMLEWIDPALQDEGDPSTTDPALDMYATEPPYTPEFLARYRAAQRARRDRLEAWVMARLRHLRGSGAGATDQAFVIHRTFADPRFMDVTLDANDRKPGGMWGNARQANYAANSIGRYTSLTAFLSQWASVSNADGPANAARTRCPALYVDLTADESSYPSTRDLWLEAFGDRVTSAAVRGADHYMKGRPDLVAQTADLIADWLHKL